MMMKISYERIIKVGGSVLTDSGTEASIDVKNTLRLFKELKPVYKTCLLVHGTGNFGKPPAIKYGYYHTGIIEKSRRQIALKIKESLKEMNQQVVQLLGSAGIPAIGIHIEWYYDAQKLSIDTDKLALICSSTEADNRLPVLFGDLLEMPVGDFKVISSDWITSNLAKIFRPQSTIFLSDVDGVFFASKNAVNGKKYLSHELNRSNIDQLYKFPTERYDVSGGMRKKAALALEIRRHSGECFIGNGRTSGLLEDLFRKRKVKGTYVN